MAIKNRDSKSKKNIVALLAAFGMTLLMGVVILAVGANALFFNKISPAQAAVPTSQAVAADQATIQQLQDLVAQYQSRETQYKSELQQATDGLNQANQQIQQYKQLTQALIDAGVIQINSNGQVSLGRGVRSGFGSGGDD
jgi:peptidyl-tRNA hydrolase